MLLPRNSQHTNVVSGILVMGGGAQKDTTTICRGASISRFALSSASYQPYCLVLVHSGDGAKETSQPE